MKTSKLTRDKELELYKKLVKTGPGTRVKGDTIPPIVYWKKLGT